MRYKIERFLQSEDNKEALKLLVDKMKIVSDIRNCKDEKDFSSRKIALEVLEDWISELFEITQSDIRELEESDYDEIIKTIDR